MREFLLFAIERNMISNKYGIEIFYTCFMEAAGEKEFLDKSKFYYAIFLLSKALYGHSENPFEEMYQKMLIDSNVNNKNDCKSIHVNLYYISVLIIHNYMYF
jgi:hypothetical protein